MADPIDEIGKRYERQAPSKEERLRTLQSDFEGEQVSWKGLQEKAKHEGNHLVAIACGDKADKYRDLIRILKILNS